MSMRIEFVTNCHTEFDDGWALIETLFESIVMRDEMKSCNVVAHCNGSLKKRDSLLCPQIFGIGARAGDLSSRIV